MYSNLYLLNLRQVKKKIIKSLIILTAFSACTNDSKIIDTSLEKSKREQINELANRYLILNRFSGTVLVAQNGKTIFNQSFGLADYENSIPFSSSTAFNIGEIGRPISTQVLIGILKDQKIKPSTKLSEYLISIDSDSTIEDLIQQPTAFDNNSLEILIENISNKSYQENIETYSKNLGLDNTYFQKADSLCAVGYQYHNYRGKGLELVKWVPNDQKEAFRSKGLKSTAGDLLKILNANPTDLYIDGYTKNDGFSYSLMNNVKDNTTIIILSNRRHPVASEISGSIQAILDEKENKRPLLREPFDIDKSILRKFLGTYSLNDNVVFDVLISNDSLYVLMGNQKVFIVPQSSHQFYMEDVDASLRFLTDSTNTVNQIELLDGFMESEKIATRIK